MQEAPLLEKLDWFFTSEAWTLTYPDTTALSLARITSDHIPCVIKIGTCIPRSKVFRFENFWLQQSQFKEVVKNIWDQQVAETNIAKIISAKFKRLRKGLKNWSKYLSDLKCIVRHTNEVILFYDTLEEFRLLTNEEAAGRQILKDHMDQILAFQKAYWK